MAEIHTKMRTAEHRARAALQALTVLRGAVVARTIAAEAIDSAAAHHCPDGARLLPVGSGRLAIIDAADFEALYHAHWHCRFRRGAVKSVYRASDRRALHNILLSPPAGLVVDHINGDPLDNRRSNLRLCTPAQNACNRRKPTRQGVATGLPKGVRPLKSGRFFARIRLAGKWTYLGSFDDAQQAGEAYDQAALRLHGAFARINAAGGGQPFPAAGAR